MTDIILKTARLYSMFPPGCKVLAAISGGADSTAMVHALTALRSELGVSEIVGAHFNHMLRGRDSDNDAELAARLAHELGIKLLTGRADVRAQAAELRCGIEETARALRYEFFSRACAQTDCSRIATGHTADDNAETVIMNLTRGSGLTGACGIPPVRGAIVRPLIGVSHQNALDYLASAGIGHAEDASNQDVEFSRNRIRLKVIPELASINPQAVSAINEFTELARRDADYIASQVGVALMSARQVDEGLAFDAAYLSGLHVSISSRLCRSVCEIISGNTCELSHNHIADILRLCENSRPSAMLNLPSPMTARRIYTDIVFCIAESGAITFEPAGLTPDSAVRLDRIGVGISCSSVDSYESHNVDNLFNTFYIRCDSIKCGLSVRPRKQGDKLRISGRGVGKSLKKLFIENRIPAHLRQSVPVIADGDNAVAVMGLGMDQNYSAVPGLPALKIEFSPEI